MKSKEKIDLKKLQRTPKSEEPVEAAPAVPEPAPVEAASPAPAVRATKSGKVAGFSMSEVKELISELMGALFKETMPAMVGAAVTAVKRAEHEAYIARQPKAPGETCQDCGQFKIACKGEHKQVVLYPKRPKAKWGKFFPPIVLNGIKYLSSRPGHKVTVPKDSNPEIFAQDWEANEEAQAEGREVEFNSGVLSGSGKSTMFQADARTHWH